jgi:hypothetical protein
VILRRVVACCGVAAILALGAGVKPARGDDVVNAIAIASVALVLESLFVDTPTENESDFMSVEGGRFDAVRQIKQATEFGLEYRSGYFLWKFKPFFGGGLTTNESFYGYGGIRLDTYWGEHIIVTPSFAIVGYDAGDGKNLGHPSILGRSGFDFQYRFDDDIRLGLAFHHMSNGKVFDQKLNPGTELVGMTFSVPVKLLMDQSQ